MQSTNKELETTIAKGIVRASVWLFIGNFLLTVVLALAFYSKKEKQ